MEGAFVKMIYNFFFYRKSYAVFLLAISIFVVFQVSASDSIFFMLSTVGHLLHASYTSGGSNVPSIGS